MLLAVTPTGFVRGRRRVHTCPSDAGCVASVLIVEPEETIRRLLDQRPDELGAIFF
jgi:hypothetical protein